MSVTPLRPDRSSRFLRLFALLSVGLLLALMAGSLAAQTQVVWNQPVDGYGIIDSTVIDSPFVDIETADDFDLVGSVSRVIVGGHECLGCGGGLDVNGVWVRFYDWVDGDPGALQHEVFVADGDPALVYDPDYPDVLDITLAQPFIASGKHFVSVQLATPGFNAWNWWTAHDGQPLGSTLHQRDRAAGGPWQDHDDDASLLPRDLAFTLWGEGPPPPTPPILLHAQYWSFLADGSPSTATPGGESSVAADDFDLHGDIQRVRIRGAVTFQGTYPEILAARVRFYAWQAGVPGVVLYDETIPVGPDFDGAVSLPDIRLVESFEVQGKGFVSVQLVTANEHAWSWSHANVGEPVGAGAVVQASPGAPWLAADEDGQPTDLCIELFGQDDTPPLTVGQDPCGEWQSVPVDLPADVDHMVGRDLTVIAADDVWMTGSLSLENGDGGPFTMHFDGVEWSLVPTPKPEPYPDAGGVGLQAIAHAGPDDVWAAGTQKLQDANGFIGQQTLVMRWDGSQWDVIPSPISNTGASGVVIRDIEVISADDIWFVGDWVEPFGCDFSLAMHWDGSDFTVFETPCSEIPANNNGFGLESVSAVSSDEVWAVGGGGDNDYTINTYVLHWDGSSWEHVPSPQVGIVQRLFAVEAVAADDVWASGQYLDGLGYHAFAIHWDGGSWTVFDGTDFPTGGGAIHAFASDDIYAAGGGVTHWDGESWTFVEDFGQFTGENLGVSITGLDAAAPCELWAGGREVVAGEIVAFSARQVTNKFWALLAPDDCDGSAPPDSLLGTSAPVLGGTASVAIDDPFGATALTNGATWWLLSLAPAANTSCGDVVAKYGIGFAPGRLRLDVTHPTTVLHGPLPWAGPGQPSIHSLGVPGDPTLAGLRVYTQGLIKGPGDVVLTDGLELQLGL